MARKMRRLLEPYLELVQLAAARESIVELPKLNAAEKERVYSDVRRAVRDHRLRRQVLDLWGPQCAACGMRLCVGKEAEPWECEVAHIDEVCANDVVNDGIDNALPICRTHHWAFDHRLWAIDPKTMRMVVAPSHQDDPALAPLDGAPLRPGKRGAPARLRKEYLRKRWRERKR